VAIVDLDATLAGSSTVTALATVGFALTSTLSGTSSVAATLNIVTGYAAPVNYVPPARTVQANRMVLDQVDLFLVDGKTRSQDVPISGLQLRAYLNGAQVSWPLVSGTGVPDVRVSSGKVYWTEFSAGFYNIRFYPNMLGLWRVLLTYPAYNQTVSLSYDVVAQASTVGSVGIRTSFVRR